MKNYHPDAELAPRDVVSRAIISQMLRTRRTHVYLDLTHLDGNFIKNRFPRIYTTCLQYNLDITKELIPVSPAAHYIMGGVKTDTNGATNIKGLYAAGEVTCTGVHGANRLASNSLLEGLVFGARAGRATLNSPIIDKKIEVSSEELTRNLAHVTNYSSVPDFEETRNELRKLMWERVGIIRCEKSLSKAREKLSGWSFILNGNFLNRSA